MSKEHSDILVVDVGGTHVKILATGQTGPIKIDSGPKMTARQMVADVKKAASKWKYTAVSIGYPGPVVHNQPVVEPHNLGSGWVGFDFRTAFGCPVKVSNDAAMQALGSYEGGRMLFLGLGTGLGSAMIVDGLLEPMELAHLPYKKGLTYEDYVGERGLERLGKKRWRKAVGDVVEALMAALQAEYVVLGGGNARLLHELPKGARLGDNANAFLGGFRMWRGASAVPESGGVPKEAVPPKKAKASKKSATKKRAAVAKASAAVPMAEDDEPEESK
ncbi:MAG TPA: ROK family protein [Bryobacteraceae bacterium]|nr:ROK family protein [Bryobacteraceae bacterium]